MHRPELTHTAHPTQVVILIALYRVLHINQDIGMLYSEYRKQIIRTSIIRKAIKKLTQQVNLIQRIYILLFYIYRMLQTHSIRKLRPECFNVCNTATRWQHSNKSIVANSQAVEVRKCSNTAVLDTEVKDRTSLP